MSLNTVKSMATPIPQVSPTIYATADRMNRGWYQPKNNAIIFPSTIVSQALEEAREIFRVELAKDECDQIWARGISTMDDVEKESRKAFRKYQSSRSQTKTRKWLLRFSQTVSHYGFILDMLVPHHPKYVSLAWGSMKFLFTAVINQEDLIKEIAKALAKVGEVLPRIDFTLVLYPTDMMQEAVAMLYAHLMKFLRETILWCKKSKTRHAVGSIFRPWALSWNEIVQELAEQSRRIDRLASIASKAELRDMHEKISQQGVQLAEIIALFKLQVPQIEQLVSAATATRAIQESIKIDLSSQKKTIQQIQLNQILSIRSLQALPAPGESLRYCLSLQRRNRIRLKLSASQVSEMQTWASEQKSSVMIIQSQSQNTTKDLLLDLVGLIRNSSCHVIWALRFQDYWTSKVTCIDILRLFVMQAMQINPGSITSASPITSAHLNEAAGEEDWIKLLGRALDGISEIYIVIDAKLLAFATKQDRSRATRFIELCAKGTRNTFVKLFVSSDSMDQEQVQQRWKAHQWSKLIVHDPIKPSQKRQRKQRHLVRRGRS